MILPNLLRAVSQAARTILFHSADSPTFHLKSSICYSFLQTHTRTRKAANIRIYQHVTGVNQDHLHSVTQSSMDRTEPANTFAGIIRQKSALKRFVMLNQSFWWFWLVPAGQGELLQAQNGGWNSCKKWTYMLKGGVKVGPGIGESRTALATGVSSSSEEEELSRDQVIFPGTKTCLHIQQIELILTVGFEVELSVKEGKQQEEEVGGLGRKRVRRKWRWKKKSPEAARLPATLINDHPYSITAKCLAF